MSSFMLRITMEEVPIKKNKWEVKITSFDTFKKEDIAQLWKTRWPFMNINK